MTECVSRNIAEDTTDICPLCFLGTIERSIFQNNKLSGNVAEDVVENTKKTLSKTPQTILIHFFQELLKHLFSKTPRNSKCHY